MKTHLKSKQSGLSFLGLLFVGSLVAMTGVVVAQIVPTVIEFEAVKRAVKKSSAGNTPQEVRAIYDRAAAIDNIPSMASKDLDITKENDKIVVNFAYQREIHLAGPGYLILKYAGSSK